MKAYSDSTEEMLDEAEQALKDAHYQLRRVRWLLGKAHASRPQWKLATAEDKLGDAMMELSEWRKEQSK